MRFRRRLTPPEVGFQMTPMIDVIFLLLVFFISGTIFAQWERALGVKVPVASEAQQIDRSPGEIIINVTADGRIIVNQTELTIEQLGKMLSRISELFSDQAVIIRGDKDVDFGKIVQVLDTCAAANIWNVSFATIPPEEKSSP